MKSNFIELTSKSDGKKTLINILKIIKVIESSAKTCIFFNEDNPEYYEESYNTTIKLIKDCYL